MNDETTDAELERALTGAGAAWRARQPAPRQVAELLAAGATDTGSSTIAATPRRGLLRRGAVVAGAVVVAVLVVLAFVLPRVLDRPHTHTVTPLESTADTFVGSRQLDGGTASVDLLSRTDGHVVRHLVTSDTTTVSAVRITDSTVVVAESQNCAATVVSIDVATGAVTTLWKAAETVEAMALSPDGSRLAYLSSSPCRLPPSCSGVCNGPEQTISLRPVVADLLTGDHRQTYLAAQDQLLSVPAWSPDGSQFATTEANDGRLEVYDVAHPAAVPTVRQPPAGCHFLATSWPADGMVAAVACGSQPEEQFSPSELARLDDHGAPVQTWPLPDCIDGFALRPGAEPGTVLAEVAVGYGNDACSHDWHAALLEFDGRSLTQLFQLSLPFGGGGDDDFQLLSP